MILLENISKTYCWGAHTALALDQVNLKIEKANIFGILGQSGAGKSTLLRIVNLLEHPNTGKVFVNEVELTSLSATALKKERQQIGMIFQHFNLLSSRTVFENIALPLEIIHTPFAEIKQTVNNLLELIDLTAYANRYPHQLSGGQKQRVAIARALATQPNILLCDEVTSSLDPKATNSILNLLQEINQTLNVTILLITHEMDVIKKICTHAGVIDQGKIIEQESVLTLFTQPKNAITKQLIQNDMHFTLPEIVQNHLSKNTTCCLIRFTFIGDNSSQPFISQLIQMFDLTVNILEAHIEIIQATTVGRTLCQLSGHSENMAKALKYVQSTSVLHEVIT